MRSFHSHLSQAFSGKLKGEDRFRLGAWHETDDGLPFLSDAQANLFCEIDRITDYGTHTIFIGRVYFARVDVDVDPLLYQDGKYVIARPVSDDQMDRDVRAGA